MLRLTKRRPLKRSAIIFTIFVPTLMYLAYLTTYHYHKNPEPAENAAESKTKYVLYWNKFWNTWNYNLGFGFESFKDCQYKNCLATARKSLIPVEKFDAIIFHAQTYTKEEHGVPWLRSPHQMYIFMNWEPPINCHKIKPYNSFYNWTMTYRFDSDIVRRHGYVIEEKTGYTVPSRKVLDNKTYLAASFVSRCFTPSYREKLTEELDRIMPLDVYGTCGKLQCPQKNNSSSRKCFDMIEKSYKFYLSFENCYCRDYSTENLYKVLQKDLVPVVYGGGDYSISAPPNSLINVEDFESAEKLVDYLYYLHEDAEEYLKYFKWKKEYRVTTSLKNSACQICKKLHEPIRQSIYHDVHEWWCGKNNAMCKLEKDLPKIVSGLIWNRM